MQNVYNIPPGMYISLLWGINDLSMKKQGLEKNLAKIPVNVFFKSEKGGGPQLALP